MAKEKWSDVIDEMEKVMEPNPAGLTAAVQMAEEA